MRVVKILSLFCIIILLSMSFNPFIHKSTNGALAISKPIKIAHDNKGEIWQLPDRTPDGKIQYIFKSGGEAPPRKYQEGIVVEDGVTLKSSRIEVSFQSAVGSEIIYKNGTEQIAKENWFVYANNKRLDWNSVSDKNLLITEVPVIESVGGYVVTDYEKVAKKEKTLFNDYGSLWIEYKVHEGKPLKHTLNFTATSPGVFTLCQELSSVDFDTVLEVDEDFKTINEIDATITKNKIIDTRSVESLSLTKAEKDKLKADIQASLPEVIKFKKNGKHLLTEITSGAKQDFKSFEYNATSKTALFCYGEFVLKKDESFLIDPDTFTSNNPTEDGYVNRADTCGGGYTKASTTTSMSIYVSSDGSNCQRAYIEWNISSIPAGSLITNTNVTFTIAVDATTNREGDIYSLEFQPSVASAETVWNDAGNGTAFVTNSAAFLSETTHTLDLGSSADTDLQDNLLQGWWGIGFKLNNEVHGGTSYADVILTEEWGGVPTLEVTYTPPAIITIDANEADGTALSAGTVIQANSTTSVTKSLNSTGHAVFTGLNGNQNFTLIYDNYVVKKTVNFSPSDATQTLTINSNIFNVDCSSTGTGDDLSLYLNDTDGHHITLFTTPTCSSDNAVTMNVRHTANGNDASSFSSTLKIFDLNQTAFGKNLINFTANSTSITTTFASQNITSDSFTIGTGLQTIYNTYTFYLDPRPDKPTGLSATAGDAKVTLSWTAGNSGVTAISGYKIYRSTDSGSTWSVLVADTGNTTSYADTGLTNGQRYDYLVAGINTYGAGTNSTSANATPVASGGGGSSGGGGGTVGPKSVTDFTLNLLPKSGSLFLGETRQFNLDFTWDLSKIDTLIVKSLVIGSANFDSLSIVPEQIPAQGKIIKDGKASVGVTVQAPPDECSVEQPTARCVNIKTYVIPVQMIVGTQDGANYGPFSTTLEVNIVKQVTTGTATILVVLMVAGVSIAGIIARQSRQPSRPKTPKQHKKATERVLKKIKTPKKKQLLKRLFS